MMGYAKLGQGVIVVAPSTSLDELQHLPSWVPVAKLP